MNNKQICKQYFHDIRKHLVCTVAQKKRYLAPMEESVFNYVTEHPEASLEELYEQFGAPEQVAATCLENEEPRHIKCRVTTKRWVVCLVVVIIVVGVAVSVISYCRYSLLESAINGYAVEVIEELPPEAAPNPTIYESH